MIIDFETLYLYELLSRLEQSRKLNKDTFKNTDEYVSQIIKKLSISSPVILFLNSSHSIKINPKFNFKELKVYIENIDINKRIKKCMKNLNKYSLSFIDNFEYEEILGILNMNCYTMNKEHSYISRSNIFVIEKKKITKGNIIKLLNPLMLENKKYVR